MQPPAHAAHSYEGSGLRLCQRPVKVERAGLEAPHNSARDVSVISHVGSADLIKVVGCLPNDAVHVGVRLHGEVSMHHHAAILAWGALQAAAVRHHLHPVKPCCLPPTTGSC